MLTPFKLSDGRSLYLRETNAGASHWVVFLPGSSAELWDFTWAEQRALLEPLRGRANLLQVNKPGIREDGSVDRRAFEKSFRRHTRVKDYAEVLSECIPARGTVSLLGFSEGAYLSPEVALLDSRVRAMTLLCGGTRSWVDEEIYKPSALNLRPILKRIGQIYANPGSLKKKWHGNSHATWTSDDNDNTILALERLRMPILALFASEDDMIDNDSARGDLERLKREDGRDIIVRTYQGVDHTLEHCWIKALRAAGVFFNRNILSSRGRGLINSRIIETRVR
jgi:pimeloyl-ACP methyl ester carboxylesterase